MSYLVIYDGNCNLCVTLVQVLEVWDRGHRFQYLPMQDEMGLRAYQVQPDDCAQGMIVIDQQAPDRRWQGSDAVEEIGRILPGGSVFVQVYRALPGLKWTGDRLYEQVRDHRYTLFGQRPHVYTSERRPTDCDTGACAAYFASAPDSTPD